MRVWALLWVVLACASCDSPAQTTLRFWTMGREGEVVQELLPEFERENPGIRVDVQQIPWSAAHEKLLTAHVGRATPDVAQLGNTWIAEFVALDALEALDPWIDASASVARETSFEGIWDTNVIEGVCHGIPWYVDTRVLFYRKDVLAAAGFATMPTTWSEWEASMHAVRRHVGPDRFAILLPINEWTQAVILGLQAGSPLLGGEWSHGAFSEPAFRRAFEFYTRLYQTGLAPPVANTEISNLYQEFERGYFSMYITGPWNVGEFRRRLPAELQDAWDTAPLPGPDGAESGVSLAGGSSLVVFRESPRKREAWKLIEFLARADTQRRFYELTGNLPASRQAWTDGRLQDEPKMRAFWEQLQRVVSTPKIPEWELIATRVLERAELAARGAAPPDSALMLLDRDVDRVLEKRRWLLERRDVARAENAR